MTENLIKDQKHTNQYSIYNGDCYDVTSNIPDESIDFQYILPLSADCINIHQIIGICQIVAQENSF